MELDEKACPYCAETIKAAAVKCRFCGEFLSNPAAAPAGEAQNDQAEPAADPTDPLYIPPGSQPVAPLSPPKQTLPTPPPEVPHPEGGLGCAVAILGFALIFTLPRLGSVLLLLGIVVLMMPHYLLLPIGHPKDSVTGMAKERPSYPTEKRLLAWAGVIFLILMSFAAAKRDVWGIKAEPASQSSTSTVADLQNKTLASPTFLAAREDLVGNINDQESAQAYMIRGEAWLLTAGTRIKVVDPGILTSKVLVLDGPYQYREGYVIAEATR